MLEQNLALTTSSKTKPNKNMDKVEVTTAQK